MSPNGTARCSSIATARRSASYRMSTSTSKPTRLSSHGEGRIYRSSPDLRAIGGYRLGPDELQVVVTKEQIESAPNIEMQGNELSQADEATLYHHFEFNYTAIDTESGRRLARR